MSNGRDFTSNLGRIYGIYTGGFIAFVILLAILEQVGVPDRIIGYLFVFFTIGIYALIGILSRTMQVSEYYVAGRRVPALYNGMATAADWMSAASFIAMAGGLYAQGYSYLAFVLGWTGGYVLVAVLIAPFLRKFGAYTVPDFLGSRYGGNVARTIGIVILFCCSFSYILGQITGTGIIASRFLGIDFNVAVFVGLVGILVCSMLGGMRAVTWTQVAQYIVLIMAYLIPVVILSAQQTGIPLPQLMYGTVLQEIQNLEQTKPALAGIKPFIQTPQTMTEAANFFALILCLMIGTASLPHVLMRFFTTPSVRDARRSVGWALFFIFLLYFTAPAYASFAKLEVYQNILGADLANLAAIQDLPRWVFIYGGIDLVKICGVNAVDAQTVLAACQAKDVIMLDHTNFSIASDTVVIATPEIAGLPYVIAGLVAAGGLAAALSTADGLLLAIANALSHDVYYRMVDPKASTAKRLVVARTLLVVVAVLGAAVATTRPGGILALVAWAFSLAAAGLFPALVMGVWWKRTTNQGAIWGMIAGFGVTLFYLIMTRYFGMPLWFGINNISAGIFGIPTAFLVTWVVSMMTPAPSKEMQDFVDSLRIPSGATLMDEKT
ncbi:MAG: sodium:solute symporter family protein [Tistlia sp.]|uniref:sodium:solute symporter family protein n=1 Tax=Tistlia sp. TaxID=3057121 RepID=UPI0034A57DE4